MGEANSRSAVQATSRINWSMVNGRTPNMRWQEEPWRDFALAHSAIAVLAGEVEEIVAWSDGSVFGSSDVRTPVPKNLRYLMTTESKRAVASRSTNGCNTPSKDQVTAPRDVFKIS
jgi:hypothetical protein